LLIEKQPRNTMTKRKSKLPREQFPFEPWQIEIMAAMGKRYLVYVPGRRMGQSFFQDIINNIKKEKTPAAQTSEIKPSRPKNRGPQPRRGFPVPK